MSDKDKELTGAEALNQSNVGRYVKAVHAVQSGVAAAISRGDDAASPKQLRVGVNVAIRDLSSLVDLLISKGVITEEEWFAVMADGMEAEAKMHEDRLSEMFGVNIKLG